MASILEKYGKIDIMKMSQLIRYNNKMVAKTENLAEHSFYVAHAVMRLGHDFKIPKEITEKAVCMAITHDIAEVQTGDIIHNIKAKSDLIKHESERLELYYHEKYFPETFNYFKEYMDETDELASLLVKTADAVSVLMYINREIAFGNTTEDIKKIQYNINERLTRLFDELKEKQGNC